MDNILDNKNNMSTDIQKKSTSFTVLFLYVFLILKKIRNFIFSAVLINILGWRGIINPADLKVFNTERNICVYPHTTWIEMPLAGLGVICEGIESTVWCVKKGLQYLFYIIMPGYPVIFVDRSKKNNSVDQMSDQLNKLDTFLLSISPEGTRSRTERFKSGYYYIAKNTKANIVVFSQDFVKQEYKLYKLIDKEDLKKLTLDEVNRIIEDEFRQINVYDYKSAFYATKPIRTVRIINWDRSILRYVPALIIFYMFMNYFMI